MSYRHFKGDIDKLYVATGVRTLDMPANAEDEIIIGYKGIGQAVLPKNIIGLVFPANLEQLLFYAIIESEYVEFEEVKEDGTT
jgi:hypothetical protein